MEANRKFYGARNRLLQQLGYKDYAEYLASDLWKRIRRRVLKRDKQKCVSCNKRATQVHHYNYGKKVLLGQRLLGLVSVCAKCHRDAEYDPDGNKRFFRDTNDRLGWKPQTAAQKKNWRHRNKRKRRRRCVACHNIKKAHGFHGDSERCKLCVKAGREAKPIMQKRRCIMCRKTRREDSFVSEFTNTCLRCMDRRGDLAMPHHREAAERRLMEMANL